MQPTLLIASPSMKDPFFERTVILLWHHDEDGAIGVICNKPLDHKVCDILASDEPLDDYDGAAVTWGGPVEAQSGTVITIGRVERSEGWVLDCGVRITRSQDALERLVRQQAPLMLCLGYAGWGPGQLDDEISNGGWLYTDIRPELLFEVPASERYETALTTLGLSASTVMMHTLADA